MSTASTDNEQGFPLPGRPTFASIDIGEWPGLRTNVHLDLGERRTVLVGRNGAGKSLLVAGVYRAAWEACGATSQGQSPGYFRCEVQRPGRARVAYEFRRAADENDADPEASGAVVSSGLPRLRRLPSWVERCWEPATGVSLWRITDGSLFTRDDEPTPIAAGVGLLAVSTPADRRPEEAGLLVALLSGFSLIPAGVPRSDPANRREIYVRSGRSGGGARRWVHGVGRIEALASSIATFWEYAKEAYDEFVGLVRRLGVARDVDVRVYEDPSRTSKLEDRRDLASISFDGLNIGLLSDGTLRVSEMLVDLIRAGSSVVLIEEPETAVHPGLLSRLLSVIDSYSLDRQVIVSTHSPIVVDWCRPDELRLIERHGELTSSRSLSEAEARSLAAYLDDEGSLSEFIYMQAGE